MVQYISKSKEVLTMKNLLTVEEIAQYLHVNKSTVYDWTHIGFIPHYKLPRGFRFRLSDVDKWMNSRKVKERVRYKISEVY